MTTNFFTRFFLALLILPCLLWIASSCTKKSEKKDPLEVTIQIAHPILSLDPRLAKDVTTREIVSNLFETLYQPDYLSTPPSPVPLLAADLPYVSEDQKTIKIRIRKGIHFQDDPAFETGKGREIQAEDFIYSWKRLASVEPALPEALFFLSKIRGFKEFKEKMEDPNSSIEGLRAIDSHTLEIQLNEPYPHFIDQLTQPFTAVVAHESREPLGTGPFILKEHIHGKYLLLEKNPHFHDETYPTSGNPQFKKEGFFLDAAKKLPLIEKLRYEIVTDNLEIWERFQKGEMDLAAISPTFKKEITNSEGQFKPEYAAKGWRMNHDSLHSVSFLAFQMKDPIVGKNRHLRQALSASIDRSGLNHILGGSSFQKASSIITPEIRLPNFTPQLRYDYDLKKARALLKKAGFDQKNKTLSLTLLVRGTHDLSRKIGNWISQEWAKLGIETQVAYIPENQFAKTRQEGNFQISFETWAPDYLKIENAYRLFYSPSHSMGSYQNPVFDLLYQKLNQSSDQSRVYRIAQRMSALLQEEVPLIPLYYHQTTYLQQPWLKNVRNHSLILNRAKYFNVVSQFKK